MSNYQPDNVIITELNYTNSTSPPFVAGTVIVNNYTIQDKSTGITVTLKPKQYSYDKTTEYHPLNDPNGLIYVDAVGKVYYSNLSVNAEYNLNISFSNNQTLPFKIIVNIENLPPQPVPPIPNDAITYDPGS